MSDDIGAKLALHEALTKELYGCSLDEMWARAFERGHQPVQGRKKAAVANQPAGARGRPSARRLRFCCNGSG